MNRDDIIMIEKGAREMIEKAARAMAADTYATPDAWAAWVTDEGVRDGYRRAARAALESASALPPEPEPEPLPMGTRKRSPEGNEAILTNDTAPVPWIVYKDKPGYVGDWLTDGDVADWEVIPEAPEAPKATIDAESLADWLWNSDDSYGEDDETWVERTTREIRAWADEHGHRPPVPEGHVTVDLSGYGLQIIKVSANGPHGYPLADAARAELARRGESSWTVTTQSRP